MPNLNKVILIGHVGQKPEIRSIGTERFMANFSLATSRSWKDKKTGEKVQKTQWHRINVFAQPLINVITTFVDKGTPIYIEGSVEYDEYTDKEGIVRKTTTIVVNAFDGTLVLLGGRADSKISNDSATPKVSTQSKILNAPIESNDDVPF